MDVTSRFETKYVPEPNSSCWLWTAGCTKYGYGLFWDGVRTVMAHRYSYEMHKNEIPEGLELDHLCRTRCCVNPDHLEPVTSVENVRRGKLLESIASKVAERTHCPQGHEYSGDNLYVYGNSRRCITCHKANKRKYALHNPKNT